MEQFNVYALDGQNSGKFKNCLIVKDGSEITAPYKKVLESKTLEECQKFVAGNSEDIVAATPKDPRWFYLTVAEYGLIFFVTITFLIVIATGLTWLKFYSDDNARFLITFLVGITTIAVAFLATLTAMTLREFKERFALVKEVLALLLGILGTIVGFYFGTAVRDGNNANDGNKPVIMATPTPGTGIADSNKFSNNGDKPANLPTASPKISPTNANQ